MKLTKFFCLFILNSCVAKIPFYSLRHFFYRLFRVNLHRDSSILRNVRFLYPSNIYIGSNSIINYDCILDGRGAKIIIGKNVDIAPQVNIWTLSHIPNSPTHAVDAKDVIIEDNVWLSNRVTILPGVKICEGTVVAAGSIVTKNTTPYSLYAGMPAVFKRKLLINNKRLNGVYRPPFF